MKPYLQNIIFKKTAEHFKYKCIKSDWKTKSSHR